MIQSEKGQMCTEFAGQKTVLYTIYPQDKPHTHAAASTPHQHVDHRVTYRAYKMTILYYVLCIRVQDFLVDYLLNIRQARGISLLNSISSYYRAGQYILDPNLSMSLSHSSSNFHRLCISSVAMKRLSLSVIS
jgi:hypothetical protein